MKLVTKTEKSTLLFLMLSFCISLIVSLTVLVSSAGAAGNNAGDIEALEGTTAGRFLNASLIELTIGGETYLFEDSDPIDGTRRYEILDDNCDGRIVFYGQGRGPIGSIGPASTAVAEIDIDYRANNSNGCDGTSPNSFDVIIDTSYSGIYSQYADAETIEFFDDNVGPFVPSDVSNSNGTLWTESRDGGCTNLLIVSSDGRSYKYYDLEENNSGGDDGESQITAADWELLESEFGGNDCEVDRVIPWQTNAGSGTGESKVDGIIIARNYRIGNIAAIDPSDTSGPAIAPTGGTGTSPEDQPNCQNEGGELSWIVCPLLGYADEIISYLDNQINTLLIVDSKYYTDDGVENIWQRMRNIAYLLLIPALLVIVIGTALGFQVLDAYTIKRALPRLFIAVIFIAISLPLLQLLIDTINIVGQGVYGLITSAVVPANSDYEFTLSGLFDPNFAQEASLTVGIAVGVLTAKIWIGAGLFLAFSAFISLAVIFFMLAFRQVLIVALIIIAPLAVLVWIFPGNDKMFKLWWGTLWKLLLLYPLIMGLLAIGRVFAYIVDDVAIGGLSEVVLKLVAYIGPFFLVPTAFKYAGGAFASVGGMLDKATAGTKGRLKKGAAGSFAKRGTDFKNGELYKRDNILARGVNNAGRRAGLGSKGKFGFGEQGRAAQQINADVRAAEAAKDPRMAVFNQTNDDGSAILGLSGGTEAGLKEAKIELVKHWMSPSGGGLSKGDAEARANKAEAGARAIGISKSNAQAAYYGMAQNKVRAIEGDDAMGVVAAGARRIGAGNQDQTMAALQGFMYHARGNGRQDMGDIKLDNSPDGVDHRASMDKAWGKQTIGSIVTGDTRSTERFASQIRDDWGSSDPSRRAVAATRMSELQGASTYASDGNQQIINDLLDNTFEYDPDSTQGLEDLMAEEINKDMGLKQVVQTGPSKTVTRPHSNPVREARGETETVTVPGDSKTVMVDSSGNVVAGGVSGSQIASSARKFAKDRTDAEQMAYQRQQMIP